MNEAGLPGDPVDFKVLTEIAIIAHLSDNLFASVLPEGLTTAQFGVLNHLLRLDVKETISELARAMQVSQPTMSSTVKKLEQKGFTRRISDASDGRARRVYVTNMGRRIRDQSVANITTLRSRLPDSFNIMGWEVLLPQLTEIRLMLESVRRSHE